MAVPVPEQTPAADNQAATTAGEHLAAALVAATVIAVAEAVVLVVATQVAEAEAAATQVVAAAGAAVDAGNAAIRTITRRHCYVSNNAFIIKP